MIYLLLFVVFILAGMGAQVVGFGISAISMAFLPLVLPVSVAIPLVAMISVVACGGVAMQGKKTEIFKILKPLLLGSIPGIPAGLLLALFIQEERLALLLGIILILAGAYGLFDRKTYHQLGEKVGIFVGFLAGLFGAALNVNGPLVGMYTAQNSELSKYESRYLITAYMFITGLFIIAGHFLAGRITLEIMGYFIFSLPGLWLGLQIGERIFKKAKPKFLHRLVYLFILVAGILLIWG